MNKIYKLLFGVFFAMFFAVVVFSSDNIYVSAQSSGYSSSGQNISNINNANNIYNSGDIIITEVHPQLTTNCLDEYVIIQSNISYSGKIELVGFGSSTASINIYTLLNTGEKLLITDNISKINSGSANSKIYIVSSITLTDGGETLGIKIGNSGTLVDNIIYTSPATEKSKFFGSNSGTLRLFDINGDPTPSKSCNVANQPTASVENCEIYISDDSNPSKLQFDIRGSYSNICSQGVRSGDGLATNANCGLELVPKLGYNHLKYNLYSGGQIICQSNYTYYNTTNIITNCQNTYTNVTNTSCPSATTSASNNSTSSNNNYLPGCGIKLQSSVFVYSENYINLVATKRNSMIYNSQTGYHCQRDFGNGQTSNECNPASFRYAYPGMYDVKLTMTDAGGSICESSYYLNLPSKYWMINRVDNNDYMSGRIYNPENFIINYTGLIKTGDFVLCDKNYYKLLYDKTKDKYNYLLDLYDIKDNQIKYIENGYSLTGDVSDLIGLMTQIAKNSKSDNTTNIYKKYNLTSWSGDDILQISQIIPNPVGSDSSGEYIQIMSFSGSEALEGKYLYYNNKKYLLHGYADEDGLDLVDKFGFGNSIDCVYLGDNQYIYDVVCYDKPKSGYIYGSGFEGSGDEVDDNLEYLKSSKDRKYILPLVTTKYMSGVLVCGGSTDKYIRQIANLKKTNANLRATNAKNRKSYSDRVAKLNAKFKSDKKYYMDKEKFARYDMYIYRNYTQILNSKLKKDYDIVRKDEEIQDYNHLLNVGLRNLVSGYVDGYFEGKKIKSYDLKKIYKVMSGENIYISDILGLIDPESTKKKIDTIQYQRNQKYIINNKSIKNYLKVDDSPVLEDKPTTEIKPSPQFINKATPITNAKQVIIKKTNLPVVVIQKTKLKDVVLPKDIDNIGNANGLIFVKKMDVK